MSERAGGKWVYVFKSYFVDFFLFSIIFFVNFSKFFFFFVVVVVNFFVFCSC